MIDDHDFNRGRRRHKLQSHSSERALKPFKSPGWIERFRCRSGTSSGTDVGNGRREF